MQRDNVRLDHRIIAGLVARGSTVLDLGCGTGELLEILFLEKKCRGQGIEIDEQAIYQCIAKGLSVVHGDIDSGLAEYKDKSFDYVILNQSLQQVTHFDTVLNDALRVGENVIIGFPNFAYWTSRLLLFFSGRAPVTKSLPYAWYESPNKHFLSISDFLIYCRTKKIIVRKKAYIGYERQVVLFPNLFAQVAIFLISE